MLSVKEIYFRHKGKAVDILKGISFNAQKGSITTILGPNGSGKTTLFKCISGVWKYYRGEVKVDGISVEGLSYKNRARLFSIVPQIHEPPFPYSVFDVVLMGRASHIGIFSSPDKKDYGIVIESLKAVGVEHLKDIPYTKISGGERQLTLIARALAQDSHVLLFDEPTSHLDFKNQIIVFKKIKEIIKIRKVTAVITMHDPNLAMLFSDKIILMNGGGVIASGDKEDVINENNLRRVYDMEVSLFNVNGIRIITPKI